MFFADNETQVSQEENKKSFPSPGTYSETSEPDNHQSIVHPRHPTAVKTPPLVIDIEVTPFSITKDMSYALTISFLGLSLF